MTTDKVYSNQAKPTTANGAIHGKAQTRKDSTMKTTKAKAPEVEQDEFTETGEQAVIPAAKSNGLMMSAPQPTMRTGTVKGDTIIPRLLLMQSTSEMVKARKAQYGDIIKAPSGERMGGATGPGKAADSINIIPLSMTSNWTIMDETRTRFVRTEPRTDANDNLPWTFTGEDGELYCRLKTVDVIALLPEEVNKAIAAAGDGEDIPRDLDAVVLLPVAISFRSSGFAAGKVISTFFTKVDSLRTTKPKVRPFHFMLPLSCIEEENDKGAYYVFTVGNSKNTDTAIQGFDNEKGEAFKRVSGWYETVNYTPVKVFEEPAAVHKAQTSMPRRQQF